MTIRLRRFAIAFAFAALAGSAMAESIYKWTDAEGHVHYGSTPPPGQKTEKLHSQAATPDAAPPQNGRNWQEQLDLSNQRHYQTREKDQAAAQKEQEDHQRCGAARARVEFFERGGARYRVDEQGERQYLDDSQRQAELEQARQLVATYCR